ncbi:NADPH:quinone oxidoreductase family protein [Jannaschia aquimarina]|uniref:AdhT protein n=1 Tax=Jannaschia aquimarina TaxID=935700 RepID=A0A0D1DBW2_9RHOB|nr:NADPH:quinone oxidoreductase family protein [Jannaschia aquimarina]KIT17493.1 Alcohol dehydrogenase [Jannaschia aquimarina]SNS74613.1 NADPH2:quinone reductase [Jannaschia aquimarina]
MRHYLVHTKGEPPELRDAPEPEPGPGEVRLRIEACGLNFADLLMVDGTYQDTPDLPFVPGMEVCGTVEALGEGVEAPAIGSRVACFAGQGGLAEAGLFPARACVAVPAAMPSEIAAGFIVAYSTSHVALTWKARLQAGERLVVLGAAGGVGLTAVELGARMGADVVAVARGPDKLEVARAAGAHHLVDAEAPDLRNRLRDLGGADVVYDAVGGKLHDAAFRAMRPGGRLLVIGFASGEVPQPKLNHLLVKNVDLLGLYWGGLLKSHPHVVTDSIASLFSMYERGDIAPHVSHVLPLEKADEALELLRRRKSTGKVVVRP